MKEAIILAGGLGTRLKSEVPILPKALAPINGRPFIHYLLDYLDLNGFSTVILAVGYGHNEIINALGSCYKNIAILYSIEEKPLGTGGAIRLAMEVSKSDHVYIFNGDTLANINIQKLENEWEVGRYPIIVGIKSHDTSRYGRLVIAENRVIKFEEKVGAGAGIINSGCYIFNKGQLNQYPLNIPFSIEKNYLEKNLEHVNFKAVVFDGFFIDIGTPSDFKKLNKYGIEKYLKE